MVLRVHLWALWFFCGDDIDVIELLSGWKCFMKFTSRFFEDKNWKIGIVTWTVGRTLAKTLIDALLSYGNWCQNVSKNDLTSRHLWYFLSWSRPLCVMSQGNNRFAETSKLKFNFKVTLILFVQIIFLVLGILQPTQTLQKNQLL